VTTGLKTSNPHNDRAGELLDGILFFLHDKDSYAGPKFGAHEQARRLRIGFRLRLAFVDLRIIRGTMNPPLKKIDSDATSDSPSPSSKDTCAALFPDEVDSKERRFSARCWIITLIGILVLLIVSATVAYIVIQKPADNSRVATSSSSNEASSNEGMPRTPSSASIEAPIAAYLINVSPPTIAPLSLPKAPHSNKNDESQTEDDDEGDLKSNAPVAAPSPHAATVTVDDNMVATPSRSPLVLSRPVTTKAPWTVSTPAPLTPPTPAPLIPPTLAPVFVFQPILINAGGPLYTDSKGRVWLADENFATTGVTDEKCPVVGTEVDVDVTLYCTGRIHMNEYEIPIVDKAAGGVYTVTLYFYDETSHGEFDIYLEDILVHRELGEQEDFSTYTVSSDIKLKDGSLNIVFVKRAGNVRIAAIEVDKADSDVFIGDLPTANLTYIPGRLTVEQEGLILSEGLNARLIARTGRRVELVNGALSNRSFHVMPDAGATFPDDRPGNEGGWIYVSNSEADPAKVDGDSEFPGGVGAITFNANGEVIDYTMVLEDTRQNCGGGRTPWGSWVSGEEYDQGRIYQVDPTGQREGEPITMGETYRGKFESFAYDARNRSVPRFFMTKDDDAGELRRLYVNQ
jgi:hypothetical protein